MPTQVSHIEREIEAALDEAEARGRKAGLEEAAKVAKRMYSGNPTYDDPISKAILTLLTGDTNV